MIKEPTFFSLYNKLKADFPSCAEEHYHRAINEKMGWECVHPLPLLRIGEANGIYLIDYVSRTGSIVFSAQDKHTGLKRWFQNSQNKSLLWCPVCQTYPYSNDEVL